MALLRLMAGLLALVGLASLGGAWSGHLDVLTHFTPLWLAAALGVLVLWLLIHRRGRFVPLACAAAILSGAALMAPELLARPQPVTASGPTLKLVQFNVWGRNRDPKATARWILDQKADVVVLQEAFELDDSVARLLAPHFAHGTTCSERRSGCSTVILYNTAPIATEGLADRPEPFLSGATATLPGPAGPFTVVGVHYTWPLPPGPQARQREALARVVDAFPRESTILTGDFNLTPWSFALRAQDRRLGLQRRTRALFSWPAAHYSRFDLPAPLPVLPIDHVYAGSGWRTVSVERGPRLGSDHYPVVVVLTPAQPSPPPASR